jgi:indolepyruvate ferredoxin oxidoreductase
MASPTRQVDRSYELNDRYGRQDGRVYLTGVQALVRLPMMQIARDRAAGLNTAGFISGYRGSPLGGYDQELWKAKQRLDQHNIVFRPGLNEDLGATAVWGSQQIDVVGQPKYDGVVGLWYGKGPGVDRSLDVLRHANAFGTTRHGGVLAIAGDDHGAQSSTIAHQSDLVFSAAMIPVLYPANIHELLDFGLAGIALSRFSGLWAGLKAITETVESSASIDLDTVPRSFIEPTDVMRPGRGLNFDPHLRWPEERRELEENVINFRLDAARAFVRVNGLDRIVYGSGAMRYGIVTTGKAHLDFLRSLDLMGISPDQLSTMGVGVYKVGMSWPVEPENLRKFARGLDGILVIEEKRSLIEAQLHDLTFNWPANERPRIVGKRDEHGAPLFPEAGELSPNLIARVFGRRLLNFVGVPGLAQRLDLLDREQPRPAPAELSRSPYFCSGCPHNSSTKVPDGSLALGGIGCHIMALSMDRNNVGFTQMGGEGASWIGMEPFTHVDHVFQNLGDGTYQHSGSLAVRAAVQAGAHITYKILFNDAVAMTGGQKVDAQLTVPDIAAQMLAEGVGKIIILADDPARPYAAQLPTGIVIRHRDELDFVQRELRAWSGVSVLIYDQTCAAEKRRRRKQGSFPDPAKRVIINPDVCEGCGDCSVQSNCLSVEPLDTELGTKRIINQSSCNKDYSCVEGFCPSFVTIEGVGLAKPEPKVTANQEDQLFANLPHPPQPDLTHENYNILVTGIGGTGVITIGALIGMAAHLEGRAVSVLDFTGLAQKGGAVLSHIRIAEGGYEFGSARLAAASCDLLLGCDLVVSATPDALDSLKPGRSQVVVNAHATPTSDFVLHRDMTFPKMQLMKRLTDAAGLEACTFIEATDRATEIFGDSIATNLFMLGFALQKGLVPVSIDGLVRAIELNGVAVEANKRVLNWGRLAAFDPAGFDQALGRTDPVEESSDWRSFMHRRISDLTAFQNAQYARRYEQAVERIAMVEGERIPGQDRLTNIVARMLYKVMAYKDEYEVARLHLLPAFADKISAQFQSGGRRVYHLAPPFLSPVDRHTGLRRKRAFPGWLIVPLFRLLVAMKGLRGTRFDPFAHQADRKLERQVMADYFKALQMVVQRLDVDNYDLACQLLNMPAELRGYGHVKKASFQDFELRWHKFYTALAARQLAMDAAA